MHLDHQLHHSQEARLMQVLLSCLGQDDVSDRLDSRTHFRCLKPDLAVLRLQQLVRSRASVLKTHTRWRVRIDAKLPFKIFVQTALRSPGQTHRYPRWPYQAAPSSSKDHKASSSPAEGTTERSPYPCLFPTSRIFWHVLQKLTRQKLPTTSNKKYLNKYSDISIAPHNSMQMSTHT